ncbi:MAG TPA: PP2C family serine/threonine-protein phosphatase [Acidisphaera sp.]|nr:PP2C family serine/threonine-protein phosphatase [Acidisphaera sp.]
MTLTICSSATTDTGPVRTHNEDAFVDRPDIGLWAVADGAGGHQAGEVASGMIAETLAAIPPGLSAEEMLAQVRARISATHEALRDEAARRGEDTVIASTIVLLLVRQAHFACLWAGDSRAYLLRDGQLSPISRDHSLVQELVDCGMLAEESASSHPSSNVITRAVGGGTDTLELDKVTGEIRPGDRFLLCSDGLCKTISDAQLAALLQDADPVSASEVLVRTALANHASDNVTAVVVSAVANGAGLD